MSEIEPVDFAQKLLQRRAKARGWSARKLASAEGLVEIEAQRIEVDRIKVGVVEFSQQAPKKNLRPSFRRRVVKKAVRNIVEGVVKLSEQKENVKDVAQSLRNRVDDWCRRRINPIKPKK